MENLILYFSCKVEFIRLEMIDLAFQEFRGQGKKRLGYQDSFTGLEGTEYSSQVLHVEIFIASPTLIKENYIHGGGLLREH